MKQAFENIFVKMGVILVLILILLIPSEMVGSLIHERMQRHEEAVAEVSSKHASQQTVVGPVLSIPYKIPYDQADDNGNVLIKEEGVFHILPDQLNVAGEVSPEERKRGIFTVVVFGSKLEFNGNFANIELKPSGLKEEYLDLSKAFVSVGISDLKGLNEQVMVNLGGKENMCRPGLISSDVITSGVHFMFPLDSIPTDMKFNFSLNLNGSEHLGFAPIGKETSVSLKSKWSDPSFDGDFIPSSRKVTKDGFEAKWNVLNLNRNYPQSWKKKEHTIRGSEFGVELMLGMDVYQKSMRVAKYSLLFIILTFLVFFFVEVINRILIHPIQYILVGVALVLFYVLMLALSEQFNFNMAYFVASAMTISLILMYGKSVLKSWGLSLMTSAILTIMYGFIFIIIQLQDYALLFGSLGVFLILAVTMYFSKKIDWFAISELKEKEE